MLTAEQRRARDMLKAQIKELERPGKLASAKTRRDARKARAMVMTKAAPEQRQERRRDNAYLAHTRRQPCILAGIAGACEGPVEATHLRFSDAKVGRINPGMGRKPDDRWVLPACAKHHRDQHAAGDERKWWSGWGIDPSQECITRYDRFRRAP